MNEKPITKPRLLDLFCGAGGASRGYQQAGFYVVGVDINPQPRYAGDEFHQADALTFPLDGFDAIHASPPCQAHSVATPDPSAHVDLLTPMRARLMADASVLWVLENVPGAPMRPDVMLCGSQFDKPKLRRHRWFEFSQPTACLVPPCAHARIVLSVTGTGYGGKHRGHNGTKPRDLAEARLLMGIDWMSIAELSQAIPPAYTRFIGEALLASVESLLRKEETR